MVKCPRCPSTGGSMKLLAKHAIDKHKDQRLAQELLDRSARWKEKRAGKRQARREAAAPSPAPDVQPITSPREVAVQALRDLLRGARLEVVKYEQALRTLGEKV